MSAFLKTLFNNVLAGPSTDPFPFGETFTPARFRGKVKVDPKLCMGCGICKHVCTAGAVNIKQRADQSGYDITVWHNSCCLCANCRTYCPVKAITLSADWHNAHTQDQKFEWVEKQFVPYVACLSCGFKMRALPLEIARRLYAYNPKLDPERISRLCPRCRRMEDAKSHITEVNDNAPKRATES
jgi:formate hydrogenlyase subunit 6/NADH:ubiquinone oxidoreductase subunit I